MLARAATGALALLVLSASVLSGQSPTKRPVRPSDIYRIRAVSDPQRSPDGKWVSYTVSSADSAKDKSDSDVWMTSWDGTQTIRVTSTPEGESKARWSPDGKYLPFVSSRQGAENGQLWLMDRAGGEARPRDLGRNVGQRDCHQWRMDRRRH